ERAEPGERLALRSELAAVRQQMESDPHLEEYLELRTGATVDQADLALLLDPPAAAGERCVCIHWGQAGSRFVLLVIRPGGATEMRVLPSEVSVENVQAFVRANLGPAHFRLALRDAPDLLRVMDPLIAPLAELTQPDELLILAPAGPLYALPLHALELNGAPLLARNPVVYSPSLGVLRHCLARRKERPLPRKMVLFGDPSGDRAEAAELVQHLARRFLAETRSGAAVTRAAFTDLASGRDVVHFQGHARHDRRDALNSHLVLADGPFTARDVFGLRDLVAEIVTLGACESAANVLERGDEPLGLVPAFLVAGAGAVLATLWPVHRASAAWVMRRFYETLDDRGGGPEAIVSKARALRTVMLEAAEQPGWEVPYHWAPFVLTGDWA
ncbi:MAG TPA: CHAT domain-containing protein, partial [Armatimonadota bacterium]|nr:CHAT domain-containing protein [Armatimonadota bacterium]